MPTERIRYVDPDAAGLGNGLTLADAYTGLVAAIAGEISDPDLVANDEVLAFEVLASSGSADTGGTPSVSSTWTTDSDHPIVFRPYTGHSASTEWDPSKYRLSTTSSSVSIFRDLRIENIQIELVGSGSQSLYSIGGGGDGYRVFTGCYIRYAGSGGSSNRAFTWGSNVNAVFTNNIFEGGFNQALLNNRSSDSSIFYNNTFVNCLGGVVYGGSANTALLKNNLFSGCTSDASGTFSAGTDSNSTDNASIGYTVTGGGNIGDRTSQTFTFASVTDYAITGTDTGAREHGLDLTADANYPFADDIDGNVRASIWDIGAYQVTVSPAGPATRDITLNAEATHDVVQIMAATSNVTDGESVLAPIVLNQAPEDNMQFYAPKSVNGMNITWNADGTFTTDADQTETIRVYFFSPAAGEWGATDLTISQSSVTPTVTLSSPTPSGTLGTTTTATLGATTDTNSGQLFGVVDTAANITGITASQIKAGDNNSDSAAVASSSSTVTTLNPTTGITGLTEGTLYSYALVQTDSVDSNVVTGTFTTASVGVPATLTNPTPIGVIPTVAQATIGATTDIGQGTFYTVVDTPANLVGVTAAQIKLGQNKDSDPAVSSASSTVSNLTPEATVIGLSENTEYGYALFQEENGDSNILGGTFTTATNPPPAEGTATFSKEVSKSVYKAINKPLSRQLFS